MVTIPNNSALALTYEDEVTTYEIVEPIHLGALSRNRRDLSTRTGEKVCMLKRLL